ncbi:MAG: transposase [Fimbriimonadaceae bacterium]
MATEMPNSSAADTRLRQRARPRTTKRKRTYDVPGHSHLLTFSCYRRRPYLATDGAKDAFLESLAASRKRLGYEIVAFVVMPEHVHLLVFPKAPGLKVASILQSVKQPVARRLKGDGPFWQPGGGHDRNIHSTKAANAAIEYVHNNPVVRGLSRSQHGYKWSSASWYRDRTGPLELDPW